jgi:hypothetical protein
MGLGHDYRMSLFCFSGQYLLWRKSINTDSKAFSSNDVQDGTADLNLSYTGHVDDELPVPTSPAFEAVRLQLEASRNLIGFLWTEVNTCFTLASVAEAEQERGEQHAVQSLASAEIAYATMARFLCDPKHSKHIAEQDSEKLRAEMERLRATLDRLAGRQK